MTDRIRVGIVGATVTQGGSGWGAHAHVPALRALPEYQLKAVCTAHAETARASAEAFGAELAFDNFDQMLANPDLDLVVGFNGGSYGEFTKWYRWGLQLVPQYIIPAALSQKKR